MVLGRMEKEQIAVQERWALEESRLYERIQHLTGKTDCCTGFRHCPLCRARAGEVNRLTDLWLDASDIASNIQRALVVQGDTGGTLCVEESERLLDTIIHT